MNKSYQLSTLVAKELLELAYHLNGVRSFQVCGSNGGDLQHYLYTTGTIKVYFSNHGYIDRHGLNIDLDSISVEAI